MCDKVLLTVSNGGFQKHKALCEQLGRQFRNQAEFLNADDYKSLMCREPCYIFSTCWRTPRPMTTMMSGLHLNIPCA